MSTDSISFYLKKAIAHILAFRYITSRENREEEMTLFRIQRSANLIPKEDVFRKTSLDFCKSLIQ